MLQRFYPDEYLDSTYVIDLSLIHIWLQITFGIVVLKKHCMC